MSHQPNILLVMADQLAAQALSLYGNGSARHLILNGLPRKAPSLPIIIRTILYVFPAGHQC